jgi:hypothetical protein
LDRLQNHIRCKKDVGDVVCEIQGLQILDHLSVVIEEAELVLNKEQVGALGRNSIKHVDCADTVGHIRLGHIGEILASFI